jgi:hypothetical protein
MDGLDPCGTTRLSKDIKQGVVDRKLKVHGVENLRVMDASVMPVIPDCRIQNAVYMVAEKVSLTLSPRCCGPQVCSAYANQSVRVPTSSRQPIQSCISKWRLDSGGFEAADK